jgi:hypothetical protein
MNQVRIKDQAWPPKNLTAECSPVSDEDVSQHDNRPGFSVAAFALKNQCLAVEQLIEMRRAEH